MTSLVQVALSVPAAAGREWFGCTPTGAAMQCGAAARAYWLHATHAALRRTGAGPRPGDLEPRRRTAPARRGDRRHPPRHRPGADADRHRGDVRRRPLRAPGGRRHRRPARRGVLSRVLSWVPSWVCSSVPSSVGGAGTGAGAGTGSAWGRSTWGSSARGRSTRGRSLPTAEACARAQHSLVTSLPASGARPSRAMIEMTSLARRRSPCRLRQALHRGGLARRSETRGQQKCR